MKILHLYSDLMNLYGEYANLVVLKKHLEDQGLKVQIDKPAFGKKLDFKGYDFIYCGSGLESNLKLAKKDLLKNKKAFKKAIEDNKYILFTGNAMELLGKSIDDEETLGIFDYEVISCDKRYSGDAVVESKQFGQLVGFVNKCTKINYHQDHLFTYLFKDEGLTSDNVYEAASKNNLLATHLIGPILTKNPNLLNYYVKELGKKKKGFKFKKIKYPYLEESYKVTLNALMARKKD